jgi:hypothetical protein
MEYALGIREGVETTRKSDYLENKIQYRYCKVKNGKQLTDFLAISSWSNVGNA